MTREQKLAWLAKQLEEIKRAEAVLEKFQKLTENWLKKLEAAK